MSKRHFRHAVAPKTLAPCPQAETCKRVCAHREMHAPAADPKVDCRKVNCPLGVGEVWCREIEGILG